MILTLIAAALFTQPITTTREYFDTDGDGRILSSGKYRELGAAGTCWTKQAPLIYWPCGYSPPVAQPTDATIQPPRITTPAIAGGGNMRAPRRTDLDMARAMEAYTLQDAAGYSDVRIADVRFGAVRSMVYNAWNPNWPSGTGADAGQVHGLTIERVEATCAKYCVKIGRVASNIVIRDFRFRGGEPRTHSPIPMGITLGAQQFPGQVRNVLIERGEVSGFRQSPRSFTNGDGPAAERNVIGLTIRDVYSHDNADGGFDLKSSETRLDRLVSARNGHQNYRLWVQGAAGTLTSIDPGTHHVWVSKNGRWTIDHLIAVGDKPLVFAEAGGLIEIKSCDLSRWTGTVLTAGAGRAGVTLGEGCRR